MTPEWLKTDFILGSVGRNASITKNTYRRFVEDLLDKEYDSPLKDTVASTVLGGEEFIRVVSERHVGQTRAARNLPAVKALARRPSMDAIIMTIKAELGDRAKWLRAVSLYGCQKYSGATLKDIGTRFGISDAAVSQASRRVAVQAETDPYLKKMLDRVETCFRNVKG